MTRRSTPTRRTRSRGPIRGANPVPVPTEEPQGMPHRVLRRLLQPSVHQRWSGLRARDWTPERVETVLRGALNGDHVQQWELFQLMEDTWPRLAKALAELRHAVQQLDWTCQPWSEEGQPPTPEATERAQLVSRAVWSMRPPQDQAAGGFLGTIGDLMDAWGKGVVVLEVEWQVRRVGRQGPMEVVPLATHWVDPHQYAWSESGRLMLRAAQASSPYDPRSSRGGDVLVPFPRDQFLLGVCRARSGPVLGTALLRPLAWWWCAANFSAGWLLNLCQIFGLPIRWANYAPGSSDQLIDQICDMLENMGSSAWGAFPAGTQINLLEQGKGAGGSPQDSLLDRADRQADILILGQTLTTDVGNSGSRALGGVHKSVRDEVIQSAADWVAEVLNLQLVPAILRLNYGDDAEAPEFLPKPVEVQDLKANAERDAILLDRGVPLPRDWFYQRHQIPLPASGEAVVLGQSATAPGAGDEPAGDDQAPPDEPKPEDQDRPAEARHAIQARRSREQERLADRVLENVTAVQAEWLSGARPYFVRLVQAAQDPRISDEAFLRLIEGARAQVPEQLGPLLDPDAIARSLEAAMGASLVNGAVRGHLERQARLAAAGKSGADRRNPQSR